MTNANEMAQKGFDTGFTDANDNELHVGDYVRICGHIGKINRHSPYLSITLHKCYPYYLFGISTFPNLAYHSIALRKFSITIV